MTFTQEELNRLAVFAGLTTHTNSNLYWLGDKSYCHQNAWHPDRDPAQADLVLRALTEKGCGVELDYSIAEKRWRAVRYFLIEHSAATPDHRGYLGNPRYGKWWPEACCKAALEVIGNESINNS